jgi:thiamine-monophosphate kinase
LVARGTVSIETLLSGGDDYEVLCAVPEADSGAFAAAVRANGVMITPIGTVVAGTGAPRFLNGQGGELTLKRLSYSHF